MTTITLDDSEDKIIERLGDCHAVPVDYMDLLSHKVRCRKIEIFNYDDEVSFTPNDEEEEQEQDLSYDQQLSQDRTDDEDRTMLLVGDLDCLIRRIELMQLVIKQRQQQQLHIETSEVSTEQEELTDPTMPQLWQYKFKRCMEPPPETQVQEDEPEKDTQPDPLSCDERLEVRNLQHAHHKLQCQIDEMICNYRLVRQLLRNMRSQVCQENRRVRKMNAMASDLQQWSLTVAHEMPVCKQRYHHLLETKLSKAEAQRVIGAHLTKALKYSKKFLTSRQLRFELREFHLEIDELINYTDDLREDMVRRFAAIEQETGLSVSKSMASNNTQ